MSMMKHGGGTMLFISRYIARSMNRAILDRNHKNTISCRTVNLKVQSEKNKTFAIAIICVHRSSHSNMTQALKRKKKHWVNILQSPDVQADSKLNVCLKSMQTVDPKVH